MSIGEQLGSKGQQLAKYMQRSGIMLAVVTNINDPETLGRIKCKPVSDDPDVLETDWCFCLTPSGGKEYGIFFFPNVDDLVVLAFLNGDVHHPLVLGRYWANDVTPPYKIESGKNEISSIKTPGKIEIKFDDCKGKEKLSITTPSGANVIVDDENQSIAVSDKGGDNMLTLLWEKGEIELKAKKKLTLSAGDTSITLESSGSISGEANQKAYFKAANVELEAATAFKASGGTVDVNADGQMTLQASGPAVLKGLSVNIN